jgi:hypothetical protein
VDHDRAKNEHALIVKTTVPTTLSPGRKAAQTVVSHIAASAGASTSSAQTGGARGVLATCPTILRTRSAEGTERGGRGTHARQLKITLVVAMAKA